MAPVRRRIIMWLMLAGSAGVYFGVDASAPAVDRPDKGRRQPEG